MTFARKRVPLVSAVAAAVPALFLSAGPALAQGVVLARADEQAVRDQLGLSNFSVQRVGLSADAVLAGRFTARVDLGAGAATLTLDPYSLRSPGFTVRVVGESGAETVVPAPPLTTYRGTGSDGSRVVASVIAAGLTATVYPALDAPVHLQPLSDVLPGADADLCVVFRDEDVIPGPWVCGTDESHCADHEWCGGSHSGGSPVARGPDACGRTLDILFDTDYPYFQQNGSSTTATVADVEAVLNQVDFIYQRDLAISHRVAAINVRSVAADAYAALPLTGVDTNAMLSQMRTVWGALPTPSRDVVHLMTGRDIAGSTIGVAYVGAICNTNYGVGLSQSKFTSNMSQRTILTAHELGHNWGAPHDGAESCAGTGGGFIMAPAVSNQQLAFSPCSIGVMTSYRDSRATCVTAGVSTPQAVADAATVVRAGSVTVDVLANDSSSCGALTLSLPATTTAGGGRLSRSVGTGSGGRDQVVYAAPGSGAAASDTFTYTLGNGTGQTATGTVRVTITAPPPPTCAADRNADGVAQVDDIFAFLGDWFAGSASADFDGQTGVTVADIFTYLGAWFAGC